MVSTSLCLSLVSLGRFFRVLIFHNSSRCHVGIHVLGLPKSGLVLCGVDYSDIGVWRIVRAILASLVGRGSRLFLVAALMCLGGAPMEAILRKHIDLIGWIVIVMAILADLLLSK